MLIRWLLVKRRRIDFRLLSRAPIVVVHRRAASGSRRHKRRNMPREPPTKGALYRDGQTDRYLLGGTWLFRDDLGDVGLAQGWWRDSGTSAGWSPVTVPNTYDAGDLSNVGTVGWVGWYRRDFTLPTGAFAGYVPADARRWIIRFESVNYRASVWLNGRLIGGHAGAGLPVRVRSQSGCGVASIASSSASTTGGCRRIFRLARAAGGPTAAFFARCISVRSSAPIYRRCRFGPRYGARPAPRKSVSRSSSGM